MIRKLKNGIREFIGLKNDTDYYSQAGEDAILLKTFKYVLPIDNGFYVDIGSFHPYQHSNTYLLHKAGWTGINIDPRPGSKSLFDKHRPKDINIEAGIGGTDSSMTYYFIDEGSTMNTFSRENLERLGILNQVKEKIEIPVWTFKTLLSKYPQVSSIDYLNIDAEGFEMEILQGLDERSVMPKVISIEQNSVFTLQEVIQSDVAVFLAQKGYDVFAKNVLLKDVSTVFYIRNILIKDHK